jgi:signal peptide peptidase SppA
MAKPAPSHADALLESPWALLPRTLSRIAAYLRSPDPRGDAHGVLALSGPEEGARRAGSVSLIDVYGVIENHSDLWLELFGGTSIEGLRAQLAAELADPNVSAIVLEFDSPGGSVAGVTELASEIRGLRGGAKPVVAAVNTMCASAAYWLASQCDEVVCTPSGSVGSIGIYLVHEDDSRMLDEMGVTVSLISAGPHKTEGNPFEPLTDEARAALQERVDASYAQFTADVAAGRRVTASQVESDFGGGRVLPAKAAKAAGMVDRIETLGQTVGRLSRRGGASGRRMAADDLTPDLAAAEPESDDDPIPFAERLAAVAAEAEGLAAHARERARLRAKEGRPAFSTTTERSLRSIRGAVDELLALDEPAPDPAPQAPVEPAPAAPTPKPAPLSRADFVRHLQEHQP